MSTTASIEARIDALTQAVMYLATQHGARLTREDLAARLGVHRNTLTRRLQTDRTFPRPGPDGRWLLSEVIRWELDSVPKMAA